jgi:hypothetical protein
MTIQPHHRAIIKVSLIGKHSSSVNYSRRMYAIIRRYTPEVTESSKNECFAELTGLRTFFKMTYQEMTSNILKDLKDEIGMSFTARIVPASELETLKNGTRKSRAVTTYKEMNTLFAGMSFVLAKNRTVQKTTYRTKKVRLTIPFIGKVA